MANFLKFLFGSKPKIKQQNMLSPQQTTYHNSLLQGLAGPQNAGLSYLMKLLSGDEEAFDEFADPELRRFQEEILPMISERFAGLGALNSSGFQNATLGAGRQLTENLARLRGELKQNALGTLGNFTNQALQPHQASYQTPGRRGLIPSALGGALQGAQAALPWFQALRSGAGQIGGQPNYNAGVQP